MTHLERGIEKFDPTTTYLLPINRQMLLVYLPQGGAVAEVGVAEGDFSQQILEHCQPGKLELIDLWAYQDDAEYRRDLNNVADPAQQHRFEAVKARFAAESARGQVAVHRSDSVAAAKTFADGSFDFVYIDGNHTYRGVKNDLEAYYPKVKTDGFICGHDFSNHESAVELGFEVVGAVFDFCRERGCLLCAITTNEDFLSFVIAKHPGEHVNLFLMKLLYTLPGIVEVKNFLDRKFEHKLFRFSDNRQNLIISV